MSNFAFSDYLYFSFCEFFFANYSFSLDFYRPFIYSSFIGEKSLVLFRLLYLLRILDQRFPNMTVRHGCFSLVLSISWESLKTPGAWHPIPDSGLIGMEWDHCSTLGQSLCMLPYIYIFFQFVPLILFSWLYLEISVYPLFCFLFISHYIISSFPNCFFI